MKRPDHFSSFLKIVCVLGVCFLASGCRLLGFGDNDVHDSFVDQEYVWENYVVSTNQISVFVKPE